MSDSTGLQIALAVGSVLTGVAALGGLALAILKWYDKGKAKLYRIAARVSVRSLLHARIELFDLLAQIDDQDPSSFKSLLQRQVFHLDKALDDAEDFMPKDVLKIRDVRVRQKVRIGDVVDAGGPKQ